MKDPGFNVYLITTGLAAGGRHSGGDELLKKVEAALAGGVKGVQLREKDLQAGELLKLALGLRKLTRRYGAKLLVNDRVDIALAAGADGVHLGRDSLPPGEARRLVIRNEFIGGNKLIGVSTHSAKEAVEAERAGADFVTLGPVYPTPSKARYGEPLGPGALEEASGAVGIPVFAIGGVTSENAGEVLAAGAFGVAVISAILASEEPEKSARALIGAIKKHENRPHETRSPL
jgi:thiamine-phosphate pyrophosphorylase